MARSPASRSLWLLGIAALIAVSVVVWFGGSRRPARRSATKTVLPVGAEPGKDAPAKGAEAPVRRTGQAHAADVPTEKRKPGAVEFVCQDEGGRPVSAHIRCFGPGGREKRVRTGLDGACTISLPHGETWECVAVAAGHAWSHAIFRVFDGIRHDFVFAREVELTGVVQAMDGTPLAGVGFGLAPRLTPAPKASLYSAISSACQSDAHGRFRAGGLVEGREYEFSPHVPGAAPQIVVPPRNMQIRLTIPWLLELGRSSDAELDLLWEVRSIEPESGSASVDLPSMQRANGVWPRGLARLTIPVWPGKSRVRIRLRHGAAGHNQVETISLPQSGGRERIRTRLGAGLPILRVRNPHAHPAALFRWAANASDRSVKSVIAPGKHLSLPVPAGESRFVSAVYPHGVTTWHAVAEVGTATDVEVPRGPPHQGVMVRTTFLPGEEGPRPTLLFAPAPPETTWHVAYADTKPILFTGAFTLEADSMLVVLSRTGFRYATHAPGFEALTGSWPEANQLDLRLQRRR